MKTLWQKKKDKNNSGTRAGSRAGHRSEVGHHSKAGPPAGSGSGTGADHGKTVGVDRSWFYRFTAEEDRELDRQLVPYDILVNLAQAQMLRKIGVYDHDGLEQVTSALTEAWDSWTEGAFDLGPDDEDVHSAVENYLTDKAGQDGARIHTGRSRNDQVLADMRLFMKDAVLDIASEWLAITGRLDTLAEKYNGVCFAGLTHTQPAMPHSADAWAAGYHDLLCSDLNALRSAFELFDQSPLGSAAGYGVPHIAIDREFIAEKLGFSRVQEPVAASQLSRGRFELQLVDALAYGALTFNRMASDVVLFMHPSLALVTLSEDQLSGSSIMPQKRNPDAWELIRGVYHDLQSAKTHLAAVPANLTSGYHRDLQLVKKSVMAALDQSKMLAVAVRHALEGLGFDAAAAARTLTPEVFATHEANRLVSEGMPFREAYRNVAESITRTSEKTDPVQPGQWEPPGRSGRPEQSDQPDQPGKKSDAKRPRPEDITKAYHHSGAPGSGLPGYLRKEVRGLRKWVDGKKKDSDKIKKNLLGAQKQ